MIAVSSISLWVRPLTDMELPSSVLGRMMLKLKSRKKIFVEIGYEPIPEHDECCQSFAFSLYTRSSKCSSELNTFAEQNLLQYALGFGNDGNTCWFDCIIHAIINRVKKVSHLF